MSEYTTIYLRNKATPLLEYKEHPSWNEIKDLSDDEINKIEEERKEHNRNVERSMGCESVSYTHLVLLQVDVSQKRLLP